MYVKSLQYITTESEFFSLQALTSVAAYLAQTVDSDIGCTVYMGGALAADDNWRHARSRINSPPRALRMRPAQYI